MAEKVTAASAIKALQEASEKICEADYLKMKAFFILQSMAAMEERKDDGKNT